MLLKLWGRWARKNQIKADIWVAEQLGDPIFYMPNGIYKGQWLGVLPLQELRKALLRLDPHEDEALYGDIRSWVAIRERLSATDSISVHLSHGVGPKDVRFKVE